MPLGPRPQNHHCIAMKTLVKSLSALVVASLVVASPSVGWCQQAPNCNFQPDANGDGLIGIEDLVSMLSVYSMVDSDGDCVLDAYDNCEGPTLWVPSTITPIMDSVFIEAIGSYYVFQAWADTTFVEICPTYGCMDELAYNFNPEAHLDDASCVYHGPGCLDGTATVFFDGREYDVVTIGDQCWFAENLQTSVYANGDPIPLADSDEDFFAAHSQGNGVYCYPGGDAALSDSYGHLYTNRTAADPRGLCPSGWKIPTEESFASLERFVGMPDSTIALNGWRGTNEAIPLKASSTDDTPWNGTNDYGFSWTKGGWRHVGGGYGYTNALGLIMYFDSSAQAYGMRQVGSGGQIWAGFIGNLGDGRSARCVKLQEGEPCEDVDGDGVCPEDEVSGCSDPGAYNFNPAATEDAECFYPSPGCDDGLQHVTHYGKDYELVTIGDQCWFAENLQSTQYANGDTIPQAEETSLWFEYGDAGTGSWCYSFGDPTSMDLGLQYNFFTVEDERGLCPAGWHVPSDADWATLESELGLSSDSLYILGWRGEGLAERLKASEASNFPWNGTNTSGFDATLSGHRWSSGNFITDGVLIWASNPWNSSNGTCRMLATELNTIRRSNTQKTSGCVVRCVRDE